MSGFVSRLAWLSLTAAVGLAGEAARAAEAAKPTFDADVKPLLAKYCVSCHNTAKPKGKLALDKYPSQDAALKDTKVWEKVVENLRASTMPPEGKPRPTLDEMDRLNTWVDVQVFKVDCSGKRDPGRVTIRRLNRAEYNNTIRDLVGIDFQPAKDFPTDDVGYGFDNIGDVLSLPPLLLEKYLAAAEQIVERAWKNDAVKQRILNPKPHPSYPDDKGSKLALRAFAERAWRRPVTGDEMRRLLGFLEVARVSGDTPEGGVRAGITAILVSPHFLFRIETDREPNNPDAVHRIGDFELATRLSYFLWSSMPDDELFRLAREQKLHRPDVLEEQVRQMLRDPKSKALTENFATQWLTIRALNNITPDPGMFPTFNDQLRKAMLQETQLYFQHVMQEDRSVLEFLDSDWTFLNERLAKHYGITSVKGDEFRKVRLPDSRRGGVLTHASILTVTSNPTRTSPVKRGKWILENILGAPPPSPPPGVEELKDDKDVRLVGSLRQRMEQHRANPNCATCHTKMDALGFGLENFDAVGAWRDKDGTFAVDSAGTLPGNESFKGPGELRKILLKREQEFARTLTDRMLTYALGRGLERTDRCFVDDITKNLAQNRYRFSTLVLEIVKSDPFQMRRGKRGDK
jgi:hypothetical protein